MTEKTRLRVVARSDQRRPAHDDGMPPTPPPAPAPADYPRLDRRMTVAAAAHRCVDAAFRHLLANVAPVLESDDAEGIHQARVALRRLRSALALFRPAFADAELERIADHAKWLATRLGPARDMDVFAEELLAPVLDGLPQDRALTAFALAVQGERQRRRMVARRALRSRRFKIFIDATERWLARVIAPRLHAVGGRAPIGAALGDILAYAAERLDKRARGVAKRGRDFNSMPSDSRHDLRLALKKLRYAAEFFHGLFAKNAANIYIADLTRFQSGLGYLNDLATARKLSTGVADSLSEARAADMRYAGGLVLGWHGREAARVEARLRKAWRRFQADPGFWT